MAKEIEPVEIHELGPADTDLLPRAFAGTPWERSPAFFEGYLREQREGLRTALVARLGGAVAGHASIVWSSAYFRDRGIPPPRASSSSCISLC
jgi:hypothetical protein